MIKNFTSSRYVIITIKAIIHLCIIYLFTFTHYDRMWLARILRNVTVEGLITTRSSQLVRTDCDPIGVFACLTYYKVHVVINNRRIIYNCFCDRDLFRTSVSSWISDRKNYRRKGWFTQLFPSIITSHSWPY